LIATILRRFIAFAIVLLIVGSSLHACSSSGSRKEGYVYFRLNSNPTTLDPALIVDVMGGYLSAKIFNGLVRMDDSLNIVPDIASRWDVSADGTTFIFYLRKHVFFSNKREVTAEDFKYSFERILDPKNKSPNTWVLDKISGTKQFIAGKTDNLPGVQIVDRYILKIKLAKAFSPFLNLLSMTAAYVVPKEEVTRWGDDFSSHPIGTGPFLFKDWKHNSELVLERNDNYFNGKAKIRGLVYRIIPEDLTAVTEFELGNLDVLTIPASEYARYKSSSKWRNYLSSVQGLNIYYLGFNCSKSPFRNMNFRKAVSYALDREKILRTFYENRGRLAEGPVPDILRKWTPPERHTYNPCKAIKIIEKEGFKDTVIHFYVTADQEVVDIAEIIQSYLKKVGLQVTIKQLEWSAYKAAINNGEADMFWMSWWADYPDAENFLFPLFHSSNYGASGNRSRYTNKEVDRLIEMGQGAVSPEMKNCYYMKAERIISEESPWVFFWYKTDLTVRQPALKNYKIYPIYSMDKGLEISY